MASAKTKITLPTGEQLSEVFTKQQALEFAEQHNSKKKTALVIGRSILRKVKFNLRGVKRPDNAFRNLMVFYKIEPYHSTRKEMGYKLSRTKSTTVKPQIDSLTEETDGDVDPLGIAYSSIVDSRIAIEQQYNNIAEALLLIGYVLDEKLQLTKKLEPQLRKALEIRKDKYKILLVGPTTRQAAHIQAKVGREFDIQAFNKDQRKITENDKGIMENADLIVTWPMFTGHMQTGAVKPYKEKTICCSRAGITGTAEIILGWLQKDNRKIKVPSSVVQKSNINSL